MKIFRVLLLLFVGATTAAVAQTNNATPEAAAGVSTRALSLEDCIVLALQHNFDIQIFRYDPIVARHDLRALYGSYEPVFGFSAEHDYSLSPGGIDSQGRTFGGTEAETDRFSTGLQGLLPWGLTYDLGATVSDQKVTRPVEFTDLSNPLGTFTNIFFDPNANQNVTLIGTNYGTITIRSSLETVSGNAGALTLRQPLLQGFWIDGTRFQIYSGKKNVKFKEEDFRRQLMQSVTSVEAAYFNLVSAEDSVTVQEKGLELANRLLSENKKRVEVGALAPLDEKQAESQVASSQADLLAAQADRDTAQRRLKDLLSDDYKKDWANVTILTKDKLLALPQEYDLQESWRKGMAQNPLLIQARLVLDISTRRVRLTGNQLFPQLDVFGSYGYTGSDADYSGTFDQIQNGDNPFWTVGAQFSIPLGQTGARNTHKSAKAVKEQDALKVKQREQQLLIAIENDIASAKTSFERVDATREARRYAEAALEAEQKKLESGKSTSFIVLQLQKDLTTASGNEIRALADYNISLAQLAYDEGSTLERRRIELHMDTLEAAAFNSK